MKNVRQRTQGFTLIELLIVIAIIGILAAVLIPNLLGARNSANKRAIQAHSANVYKALQAELAESPTNTLDTVLSATTGYGATCMTAVTPDGTNKHYGWNKAPGAAASCAMGKNTGGTDFSVVVTGDASTGTPAFVATNGVAP